MSTTSMSHAGPYSTKLVVPSREQATETLCKLHSSAKLCAKLVQLSVAACELFFSQMARSFFIPFCMTAAATCASIRVRACAVLVHTVRLYNGLLPLSATFPLHARGSAAVGEHLPESLGINWSYGIPHVLVHAFREKDGYQQIVDDSSAQYSIKHYTQPTAPPTTGAAFC